MRPELRYCAFIKSKFFLLVSHPARLLVSGRSDWALNPSRQETARLSRKQRISTMNWPWGRTAPKARIRAIERMIEKTRSQIPIVEDQAREAIRRLEKNIQALEAQIDMARGFLIEEVRARNKQIAYELAELGIDRIGRIDEVEDQDALQKELLELLEEAKNGSTDETQELDSFLDSMND